MSKDEDKKKKDKSSDEEIVIQLDTSEGRLFLESNNVHSRISPEIINSKTDNSWNDRAIVSQFVVSNTEGIDGLNIEFSPPQENVWKDWEIDESQAYTVSTHEEERYYNLPAFENTYKDEDKTYITVEHLKDYDIEKITVLYPSNNQLTKENISTVISKLTESLDLVNQKDPPLIIFEELDVNEKVAFKLPKEPQLDIPLKRDRFSTVLGLSSSNEEILVLPKLDSELIYQNYQKGIRNYRLFGGPHDQGGYKLLSPMEFQDEIRNQNSYLIVLGGVQEKITFKYISDKLQENPMTAFFVIPVIVSILADLIKKKYFKRWL